MILRRLTLTSPFTNTEYPHLLIVKDAKALGTVDIVTFDWLEDSLRKQRAYSTKKYLLTTVDKKNGTTPKQKKKEKKEESEEGESCSLCKSSSFDFVTSC